MKARLLLTSILAGVLATALAFPAAAQDNTSRGGVLRLTDETAPIIQGTSAWVAVNWTAQDGEATNFRVTAKAANGATVGYPTNTADHSSLYWDATLSDSEIDYTALFVSVPSGVSGGVVVNLTVSYDWEGRPRTETMAIRVPVSEYDGSPLESLTSDLGEVEADSQNWLDLWYTAPGPIVEDVTAVVDGGPFAITYPGLGDSTGLAGDSTLDSGEKDVARFQLDTTGAGSGSHTLTVSVTYTVGGRSQTLVHDVQLNVFEPAGEPPQEETDPATSVRVVDSEGSFYWWNDAPGGGDGAWKAAITFRNDWIRHHYLTLEVSRTHSDGTTSAQTVRNFYVAAESQSTYEAWDNALTIDGDDRRGVVGVEVRVVSIRTSDEDWQTENYDTDGPVVSVEAPSAG